MIVSNRRSADGVSLVIHNVGQGTREEHAFFTYRRTGYFRLK